MTAIENSKKKFYGVQFHPEVDLTEYGSKFFENFLFEIAGLKGTYTMGCRMEAAIHEIQQTVGDSSVLGMICCMVVVLLLLLLLLMAVDVDVNYRCIGI